MYVKENEIITKIDQTLLEELRQTDLSIKHRAYAIKILDDLIQRNSKNNQLEYSPVKDLIKRLRNKVCSTHSTIHFILNFLHKNQFIRNI